MTIGKRHDSADFTPLVKFDARDGTFTRCDRVETADGWETQNTDITDKFEAIFDLEHVEVGWMLFKAGGAPDFRMVPTGQDIGEKPTEDHKEGFRLRLKLQNGAGDSVRELASTARGMWTSIDELHDAYEEDAAKQKGKLPVVAIHRIAQVKTNYRPIFEITSWVKRPADL